MEQMASSLMAAMPAFAAGPYAILGSSMGAWVGLELCQKISKSRMRAPEALFVCSATSPYDRMKNYKFRNLRGVALVDELHKLHPGLTSTPENMELIETMLPVIEKDFTLCDTWQPDLHTKLPLPIFGFCGDKDPLVQKSEMERWALLTEKEYRFYEVEGNHSVVDDPPAAMFDRLLEILRLPGVRIN